MIAMVVSDEYVIDLHIGCFAAYELALRAFAAVEEYYFVEIFDCNRRVSASG